MTSEQSDALFAKDKPTLRFVHGATEAGAAQLVHLGSALQGLNIEEAAIKACLVRAGIVHNAAMNLPAAVANSLLGKDARKVEAESSAAVTAFAATFAAYKAAMSGFEKFGALDWALWDGSPTPADAASRLAQAREGASMLIP